MATGMPGVVIVLGAIAFGALMLVLSVYRSK